MELVSLFPHFIGKESESQTWGKLAKISGGIIQVLLDGQASSLENGGKSISRREGSRSGSSAMWVQTEA